MTPTPPIVLAGTPSRNPFLYQRLRLNLGDPAAWIGFPDGSTLALVRDIELGRARALGIFDRVQAPADFAPPGGLSGDRELATAQALAECLKQAGFSEIRVDRSLPMVYADLMQRAGLGVICDPDLGLRERRMKTDFEIDALRRAQKITEEAIRHTCRTIARARAGADGSLHDASGPLTSERLRGELNLFLAGQGCSTGSWIIASGPCGADCHDRGTGPIRTGEPVIVDVFPQHLESLYHGDCTRCVVHGEIPPPIHRLHQAVSEAKQRAIASLSPGVSGQFVHEQTLAALARHGFHEHRPGDGQIPLSPALTHGSGHGIGLEVHEAPLLDWKGPDLLAGDAVTVEPGLYAAGLGGIRLEDLVIVTASGPLNLNTLPDDLAWK